MLGWSIDSYDLLRCCWDWLLLGFSTMNSETNPYAAPKGQLDAISSQAIERQHRGPLLYFAVAGIVGAMLAIPLIVPRSMSVRDDPNPLGYLIILCSFPVGGLVFRIRSRHWPHDPSVSHRQWYACLATLLLPCTVALMTGMGGQGLHMIVLAAFVSLILSSAILLAGRRRYTKKA